ncbi:hypothetical protein KP509_18G043400 [Ceratopteris richardii]|uniref:Serine aminopeptidase S33 domain-containing protein n=1 Tax=Ceratopteris richardii TaxID=49495 RepID=A0A8T2SPV8_CERRI|nr:hypothetical protein KP509_18G043400 [Ceratopteris richardii]
MPCHPIEDANEDSIFGQLSAEKFYEKHGVQHAESWMTNGRGMRLFTQSWEPTRCSKRKGQILLLHGFAANSSWAVQLTGVGLAAQGFSVQALDHQGHGRSDGLRAHLPDLHAAVDDCAQFARSFRQATPKNEPLFFFGESLGGTMALLIHLEHPDIRCDGVVLVGAMCGISPSYMPPLPLRVMLRMAARLIPTLPIVPTQPIAELSFKEPWKLRLITKDPMGIGLRPRPATAQAFLDAISEITARAHEVTAPLLVVHGEKDVICDPEGVKVVYQKAASTDKTIKIYKGMWHQLVGEPKENIDMVFSDICQWLDARAVGHIFPSNLPENGQI